MLISKGGLFGRRPKNLPTYGLEHPPAQFAQLRVGRDVQHGLVKVSHPVWMSSERLAFIRPLHLAFSAAMNMHPSLRILKLSGTGKNAVRRSLFRLLEEGELMLERLLLPETHAIAILVKDHDHVKDLFARFEKQDSGTRKEKIICEALTELKIHAAIEEEIFYPAVRKELEKDVMNEADEEHHVARVLIAELDRNGRGDDHRDAKFMVLAESVRHHIKEEEGEMLPKAKELEIDFEALGEQMLARRKELHRDGIPLDAEHKMVAAANGRGDSPAARARQGSKAATVSAGRTRTVVRASGRRSGGGTAKGRRRAACFSSTFCEKCSGRTLTATVRSSLVSRARYTSPMPPAPSGDWIS
jgi:hypothetical protein